MTAQGFSISGSFSGIANANVLPLGSEPPLSLQPVPKK